MQRIKAYIILVFQIVIIFSLIREIRATLEAKERITALEQQKTELEKERGTLEEKYQYVQSQEYLERVAREELHLSLPGEEVVIVPEQTMTGDKEEISEMVEMEKPNYLKWWEVFTSQ